MIDWVLVFAITIVYDVIYAKYTKAAADKQRISAAFHSGNLILVGGATTWLFMHNPILITAEYLGAMLGTYIGVGKNK